MPGLQIDFARRRRLASPLGWCLLLLGAVGLGVVGWDCVQAREALQSVQERSQRLARASKVPAAPRVAAAVPPEASTAIARASVALDQPWDGLLTELESLRDAPVTLLGVEAQAAGRSLRITGEAKSMADVVAYVQRLGRSPLAQSAVLASHENRRDAEVAVIRFSIEVVWRVRS